MVRDRAAAVRVPDRAGGVDGAAAGGEGTWVGGGHAGGGRAGQGGFRAEGSGVCEGQYWGVWGEAGTGEGERLRGLLRGVGSEG